VIIRQAEPHDAAAVAGLVNEIVVHTTVTFTTRLKTEEEMAQDIVDRGPAFQVAEDDGSVMGFASYFPFRAGPGYATTQEHSIVIAADARGTGVGRALMASLETVARANGVHALLAGVCGENSAGIAFHAALGFEEVGRLPEVGRKFDRWLDLVLMQKRM